MHPALSVVIATSLGWSAADLSAAPPAELLVEALATEIGVRLAPSTPAAAAAAPVPGRPAPAAEPVLPSSAPAFTTDRRDDIRYDWRLPVFRTKP